MIERTQKLFEQIENYLQGDLTIEEKHAFETKIKTDTEFRIEVEKHTELHAALSDKESIAFLEKIQKIGSKLKEVEITNKPKIIETRIFLRIAASVVLLIGLSVVWWSQTHTKNNLFDTYHEHYPVEDVMRGNTTNDNKEAFRLYSNKDYKKAIPLLTEFVKKQPDRTVLQLYLGTCHLKTNQDKQAIDLFSEIHNDSKYYEVAQWNLALTYVKIDSFDKAKDVLKYVIEYNGIYREKAESLLFDLNNLDTQKK